MKKVLIFYGSYGGGHLSAAKAINNYITENYNDVDTKLMDCVEYVSKFVNKVSTKAYEDLAKKAPWAWGRIYKKSETGLVAKVSKDSNKLMAHKLAKLIEEYAPDYIISTHPFSSQMCAYLKYKHKFNYKLATITTDYAIHKQWTTYHEYVDYFFVAHDKMKLDLRKLGIDTNKVFVSGIPISSHFLKSFNRLEIFNMFELNPEKKTILFFGGGKMGLSKKSTIKLFDILVKNYDFQIVAISGKNEELFNAFSSIVDKYNKKDIIKVLDFTDKVPELMAISDLVITKPGGLTTTESLASNLPIIAINPIPGQEEENAKFIVSNNLGLWIKNVNSAKKVLDKFLNDSTNLEKIKNNSKNFSKKESTKYICDTILN